MATSVNGRRRPHYLLVTFPAQGHINPALQLANRLIHHGATVTYATAVSAHRRMGEPPSIKGLSYAWFSNGFDDGLKSFEDQKIYMSELKRCGSNALSDIIRANLDGTEPITGVMYSLLVPWVSTVAREFHLPTTLLWIEPATVFNIYYYYYFNASYNHLFDIDPIELPGLPPISTGDLPSFIQPSKTFPSAVVTLKEHIEALESESNPKILVNTFAELEPDALTSVKRIRMIPIGPLVSSSNADDSSTAIDRPFLWVVREKNPEEKKKNRFLDLIREDDRGLVVDWCSQTAVLAHPSVGCFVTHCGWNSTVESLQSGVPVVAFPQFADQCTTAKLVEAMWRIGVRVKEREEGHVDGDEVRRCLEKVMGDGGEAEEMRRNAERWKKLTVDAAAEGGPSDLNLKGFVEEGCVLV